MPVTERRAGARRAGSRCPDEQRSLLAADPPEIGERGLVRQLPSR